MKTLVLIPPSKISKNIARDLVYGCWCKGKRIAGVQFPPLSIISIATVLRHAGFSVDLLDALGLQISIEEVQKKISSYQAVIILTSTMTINEDANMLALLKKVHPNLVTIAFGGHVTSEPESSLQRKSIDIVVRREAEYIIRDLIQVLHDEKKWRAIQGISYRDTQGNIIHNEPYPMIQNLDELPFPDRSLLPKNIHYFNPIVKRTPYTTMFTSRGCPGLCTFCSSPTFYSRKIRFRSVESVIKEMEEVATLGYKEIFFRDEIFTVYRKRIFDICKGIQERKLNLTWICSSRINTIDEEMMCAMKDAGCHMIRFGVESGVQKLLDNIKKGIKIEDTRKVFAIAKKVGIDTYAHMMIGVPGETKETLKTTLQFVKEIDPTVVTFGICTPYPGTDLFKELRQHYPEFGDGTQADISKLHTTSFYNEYFTKLSPKELSSYIRTAYKSFYLRPSYIGKWLLRIRNFDELKRVILAGLQVFSFVSGRDD